MLIWICQVLKLLFIKQTHSEIKQANHRGGGGISYMTAYLSLEGLISVSGQGARQYFGLCRLERLCHNASPLLLYGESHVQKQMNVAVPITLFTSPGGSLHSACRPQLVTPDVKYKRTATNQNHRKLAKDLDIFTKEGIPMASKHEKVCSFYQ